MKKKLTIDYILNVLNLLLYVITPIITLPYVTRIFSPADLGELAWTATFAKWFIIFASLTTGLYGIQQIASNPKKHKTIFNQIFFTNFYLTFFVLILYIFSYPLIENKALYFVQMLSIATCVVDVGWFFIGIQNFKIGLLRNFFSRLLTVIGIFILVKEPDDLWIYAILQIVSNILCTLFIYKSLPINFKNFIRYSFFWKRHLSGALPYFYSTLAIHIYTMSDRLLLGKLANNTELGLYDLAYKLIFFTMILVMSAGNVLLPKSSELLANGKTYEWKRLINQSFIFSSVSSFFLMFCWLIAIEINPSFILGKEFNLVFNVIPYMIPIILLLAWNNVTTLQTLIPMKNEKRMNYNICVSAIVNISLSFILIPKFGAIGAAIAWVSAELFNCVLHFIAAMRYFDLKFVLKIIISTLTLAVFYYSTSTLTLNSIISKIILGLTLTVILFYYQYKNHQKYI